MMEVRDGYVAKCEKGGFVFARENCRKGTSRASFVLVVQSSMNDVFICTSQVSP